MNLRAASVFTSFTLLAACAPSAPSLHDPKGGQAQCSDGKCDNAAASAIVTCTADASNVTCVPSLPANSPVTAFVQINSAPVQSDKPFTAAIGTSVKLEITFIDDLIPDSAGGNYPLRHLTQVVKLDGARTFELPFDIWTIALRGDQPFVNLNLAPQTFSIAPWQLDGKTSSFVRNNAQLGGLAPPTETMFVIEPKGVTSQSGVGEYFPADQNSAIVQMPFVFDGPGSYVVTADGVARDTGVTPPSAPDMAPPDNSVMPPTDSPDMTSATPPSMDPDPTCGGDNQASCANNGTCDDHFVFQSWNGYCHACGADGEPGCGSGATCDDHFVYESWNSSCHPCGTVGIIGCGAAMNQCDAPLVYASWNNTCQAP